MTMQKNILPRDRPQNYQMCNCLNRFACLLVIIIRKCKVENIKKGERDAVKLFIMAVGYTYLLVST